MFVGNIEAVATLSFLSFSPVGEKVPEGRMRGLPWKITLRLSARLGSAASEIVPAGRSRLRTYVSTKSTICLKNPSPPTPLPERGEGSDAVSNSRIPCGSYVVYRA